MEGDDEPPKVSPQRAAAHKEMRALLSKNTWDEVQKSSQTNTLPTKWVFSYKEDSDGYVTKFKARLCARGDLQLGVNKQDVADHGCLSNFSPPHGPCSSI
jgi:hypothetical protein